MGTGKAICNISFVCFQPIRIKHDAMVQIFKMNPTLNTKLTTDNQRNDETKWFGKFNHINHVFNNYIVDEIVLDGSRELLCRDMEFCVNSDSKWQDFLTKADARLYYDARLIYFVLEYEICFSVPTDIYEQYLFELGEKDIYNMIRNLMVKEKDDSAISLWAKSTQEVALKSASNILSSYGFSTHESAFEIPNNTGNITCVVKSDNVSEEFSVKLLDLNKRAERLTNLSEKIKLPHNSWLSFNGRFHTLKLSCKSDQNRYLPMLFHVQFMWFRLKNICEILEKVYSEFNFKNEKSYDKISMLIDELIINVEMLNLHDQRMKTSFEGDNEAVYGLMSKQWNIDGLLVTAEKYVDMFKGYLERFSMRHSADLQNRQNKTLFRISIIQIIAMISVWNDYMGSLNDETQKGLKKIIPPSDTWLTNFSLFLPLILSFIAVFIIIKSNRR